MLVGARFLLDQRGETNGFLAMSQLGKPDHRRIRARHRSSPLSANPRRCLDRGNPLLRSRLGAEHPLELSLDDCGPGRHGVRLFRPKVIKDALLEPSGRALKDRIIPRCPWRRVLRSANAPRTAARIKQPLPGG